MRHLFSQGPDYVRRQNRDGTLDSICKRCGLTIARGFHRDDLKQLEARHVCQLVERRRSVRIAYRIYGPKSEQHVRLFGDSAELGSFQWDIEPSLCVNFH
jgi:hypothetical protein